MRGIVLLLCCALCAGIHAQTWHHEYTNLSTQDVHPEMYHNDNTTQNTIVTGVIVSYQTRHWVYGSDESPPWNTKFTPKTNTFHNVTYGVKSISIQPGYHHVVWVNYVRETGEEQWTLPMEEYVLVATRNRLWDEPTPAIITWVTEPINH